MNINEMDFSEYVYDISHFVINAPGLNELYRVKPEFIISIDLSKNFDTNRLPYFAVTLNIPNALVRAIKAAKNTATVDLTIRYAKVMTDDGNTYAEAGESLRFKQYLSSRFLIFLDSTDISGTESMERSYEKSEFDTMNYQMDGQTGSVITLVLYNEKYLRGSNKISYGTLSGANMTDVIAYLCSNAGIDNILFSPVTSGNIPSQFVIPPMTLFDQLEYLQKEFSIHKNGTTVFFDLERAYIIERDASCTAYATNEYKKTYIISASNIDAKWGSSAGCYDNNTEKYYACTILGTSIPINDDSAITEHTMGNNLVYVDSATGKTYNISKIEQKLKT